MSKVKTITANLISDYGTEGTATFTYTGADSLTISSSTFSLSSLFPTITCKINYTATGGPALKSGYAQSWLAFSSNTDIYTHCETSEDSISWSNNETKTLNSYSSYYPTLNTSSFFNSNNPTTRSVSISYALSNTRGVCSTTYYGGIRFNVSDQTLVLGQSIILDAPPTFSNTQLSKNTSDYYSGVTIVSTTISELSAKYGGNISEVKLTIGNQSVTRTTDGSLSLQLNAAGTFIPTITVTDSRGQITTKTLSAITVKQVLPSVNFNLRRATSAGVFSDEGTYAFIEATFTWNSEISTLRQPTVKNNNVTISPTWYTSNTLTTAVNWNDTSSFSSPITLYSLIGTFNLNHSYVIGITPINSLFTGTEILQTLPAAFFTIDFLAGGHGVAFGQPCTAEGFYCNMQMSVQDNSQVLRMIYDIMHPVGSWYPTSLRPKKSSGETGTNMIDYFDPTEAWGGTWELLGEGMVLVSAGSNYPISSGTSKNGGSATVTIPSTTLTDQEIAHGHGFTQPTVGGGSHRHYVLRQHNNSGSGSAYVFEMTGSAQKYAEIYSGYDGGHSHDVYGGTVSDLYGASSSRSAHGHGSVSTMQPYKNAYWWHRTA